MRSTGVTVSVLEGAVQVSAAPAPGAITGNFAAIAKGQAVEFRSQERRVVEEKADLQRIDAWRIRHLEFSGTPLREAVEEFNRYSATRVVIGTPELGSVRVSGVFRIGDVDGFVYSLREVLGVETHESANEVVLIRTGP